MYFFGFITLFVLGISIRVLPHFLSLRPPQVRYFTPALVIYTAGLLAASRQRLAGRLLRLVAAGLAARRERLRDGGRRAPVRVRL